MLAYTEHVANWPKLHVQVPYVTNILRETIGIACNPYCVPDVLRSLLISIFYAIFLVNIIASSP